MSLDFLFEKEEDVDEKALMQGDILQRTEPLKTVIEQAHPYYANAEGYDYFMVLTQSCDLVRREGRKPRSRYITIAAMRPLRVLIDRLVDKYSSYRLDTEDFHISVCQKNCERLVVQTLEKLLHNTEEGYFFVRKGSCPYFDDDYCAFLPLSIALRIGHYDTCLSAKIAQLDNVFQAKLGWLVGNIYSRVGTPDLEEFESDPEAYKYAFYSEVLYRRTAWLSSSQLKELKKKEKLVRNTTGTLDENAAKSLLNNLSDDIEIIANRAVEQLAQRNLLTAADADTKERAMNLLKSDQAFRKLIESLMTG